MSEEALSLGPRVLMTKHEVQQSENFVYFQAPDGETINDNVRTDGYYMTVERWEKLECPTKIEVRLEAAGFGDV